MDTIRKGPEVHSHRERQSVQPERRQSMHAGGPSDAGALPCQARCGTT
jgi:hypothetical protein